MKFNTLKPLFIIALLFAAAATSAQSGAIYQFSFNIDPLLTEYLKVEDKSRNWLPEYSESETMPNQLIDSIKIKTEEAFAKKLNMPVKLCYHKNKKGKEISSVGDFGNLEGLPTNTFNGAINDCPQNSHYIYLGVQIYSSGGSSITMVSTKTKLKPRLQITIKVVDENKNEIWKKSIAVNDFSKIRSQTWYHNSVEVTKSEVLSPYDIYTMYLMGLDKLMKE